MTEFLAEILNGFLEGLVMRLQWWWEDRRRPKFSDYQSWGFAPDHFEGFRVVHRADPEPVVSGYGLGLFLPDLHAIIKPFGAL